MHWRQPARIGEGADPVWWRDQKPVRADILFDQYKILLRICVGAITSRPGAALALRGILHVLVRLTRRDPSLPEDIITDDRRSDLSQAMNGLCSAPVLHRCHRAVNTRKAESGEDGAKRIVRQQTI